MAQTRLRNYKHDILSFEHNIFNLGMHNPGRYAGFDTLVRVSPLTFSISHVATGISYKNPIDVTTGPLGVLLTPQGDIIFEDATITGLSVDSNAGNASIRYDLLVFNHNHIVAVGGEDGTYAIIRGDFGVATKPILADPLKQTSIGVIELPPNAVDLNTCIYRKLKCPDSGDGEDARLVEPNVFKAIQIQNQSDGVYSSPSDTFTGSGVTAKLYTLQNDGNVFNITTPSPVTTIDGLRINNITLQPGARVYLNINQYHIVRQTNYFVATYGPKGYRPFKLLPGMANVIAAGADNSVAIQPSPGEIWELELVLTNDTWYIVKIGGAGVNSAFKKGMCLWWYGDLNTNFNNDGQGINIMAGWQICNGLRNTPDIRGKMLAMATTVPSLGATDITELTGSVDQNLYLQGDPYDFAGEKATAISQANIPNYTLNANPHQHYVVRGADVTGDASIGIQGNPERTIDANWHTDGNDEYDLQGTTSSAANAGKSSSTIVTVPSGGGGIPYEFLPPVFRHVLIMKI